MKDNPHNAAAVKWLLYGVGAAIALWIGITFGNGLYPNPNMGLIGPWVLCAMIGAVTGSIELMQRYSRGTNLALLFWNPWAITYVAVNLIIALISYLLIQTDSIPGLNLSLAEPSGQFGAAIVAGIAGMLLLRSAFVSIRTGDHEYPVGPGLLLDVLVEQVDHRLDQGRAVQSFQQVLEIMKDVDATKAAVSLASLALQMLERTSKDTQEEVRKEIDAIIRREDLLPRAKALLIGIAIQKVAGVNVLQQAIRSLGDEIMVKPGSVGEVHDEGTPSAEIWDKIENRLRAAKDSLLSTPGEK